MPRCILFLQGSIGLNTARMCIELLKNNIKLVDLITKQTIDLFCDLVYRTKVNLSFLAQNLFGISIFYRIIAFSICSLHYVNVAV